jgi:hypothetical protein
MLLVLPGEVDNLEPDWIGERCRNLESIARREMSTNENVDISPPQNWRGGTCSNNVSAEGGNRNLLNVRKSLMSFNNFIPMSGLMSGSDMSLANHAVSMWPYGSSNSL